MKTPQKAGVNHMSKKAMRNKRMDPMIPLVIVLVLMIALVAVCVIGGSAIKDYRANVLQQKRQEAQDRNTAKQTEYDEAVADYMNKISQTNQVNEDWPEASPTGWDIIDLTNYPLEAPGSVTVNRADIMNNGLLLVNEWHSRPEDFDESAVTSVSGYARDSKIDSFWENSTCRLFPQAIDALIACLKDAEAVGLKHYVLQAGDTYRTYDDQYAIFQKEVDRQRSNHPSYSDEKVIERAKRTVNYPGTSEFNTGLSFRLYLYEKGNDELNGKPFYQTMQGQWLYENSWKYGIVFRFPTANYPVAGVSDKGYKTGVNSMQNIYRYVGVPNAEIMHYLDLCLEEYIEYLQEHPHVAVFEDGVKKYEITRQQVGDAATFTVEINRVTPNYVMYLDNMGGVITVYTY